MGGGKCAKPVFHPIGRFDNTRFKTSVPLIIATASKFAWWHNLQTCFNCLFRLSSQKVWYAQGLPKKQARKMRWNIIWIALKFFLDNKNLSPPYKRIHYIGNSTQGEPGPFSSNPPWRKVSMRFNDAPLDAFKANMCMRVRIAKVPLLDYYKINICLFHFVNGFMGCSLPFMFVIVP